MVLFIKVFSIYIHLPHTIALGQNEQEAKSAIRISHGKYNLVDEAITVAMAICDSYNKIKWANIQK